MRAIRGTLSLCLCALLTTGALTPLGAQATAHETKDEFMARARAQVEANQRLQPNVNKARNVILFVGDGMGIATITAARILEGQQKKSPYGGEENALSFEKFPYLAHSKTYQANQQTPDSAPTMTAIVTGSKANDGMLSIAPNVLGSDDFALAADPANHLESLLERAEKRGMWTGVVSTARLTHATPGACYSHTPNRDWESDADLSAGAAAAKFPDIARQLLEVNLRETTMNGIRSKGLEVAMGGGRENFLSVNDTDPESGKGKRKDGRNLAKEWEKAGGQYVWDLAGFNQVDPAKTGPVLGLFERSHMLYEVQRKDEPSLTEMTEKAIRILERSPEGFFLMVEGGRIDHAHHGGFAYGALTETIELARAVQKAALMTGDDTLIVVTADHSHVFTMAGYPTRGNDIMGLMITNGADGKPQSAPYKAKDGQPFTTLGYANGPGAVSGARPDPSQDPKWGQPDYRQQALIPLDSETHGGEDVAIFARGPQAHLFQGTMEQNAIYWVMAKALGFW